MLCFDAEVITDVKVSVPVAGGTSKRQFTSQVCAVVFLRLS